MSSYLYNLADRVLGRSEEGNNTDAWETGWVSTREGYSGRKELLNESVKNLDTWISDSDEGIVSVDTEPLDWAMNVPAVNISVPDDQPNSNVILKVRYSRRGDSFESSYEFNELDDLAEYVTRFKHTSLSARKGRNEAGVSEILHDGPIDEAKQIYKEAVEEEY